MDPSIHYHVSGGQSRARQGAKNVEKQAEEIRRRCAIALDPSG